MALPKLLWHQQGALGILNTTLFSLSSRDVAFSSAKCGRFSRWPGLWRMVGASWHGVFRTRRTYTV